jgi:hypothetical protein
MKIGFRADNDLRRDIVASIKYPQPAIDFRSVNEAQLGGLLEKQELISSG